MNCWPKRPAKIPSFAPHGIEAVAGVAPTLAADAVLTGLSDPEAAVRYSACLAAGQLRLKAAYAPLLAMLHDPDRRVQVAERFALHKLGDTRFSHDFELFTVDKDPNVPRLGGAAPGVAGGAFGGETA